MVQANELRIGNWVNYLGIPFLIEDWEGIKDAGNYPSKHSGIPLTPEVLEKCGFVKKFSKDACLQYESENNGIRLEQYEYAKNEGYYFLYNEEANIQYLHELQNLYFALTKDELNYNI